MNGVIIGLDEDNHVIAAKLVDQWEGVLQPMIDEHGPFAVALVIPIEWPNLSALAEQAAHCTYTAPNGAVEDWPVQIKTLTTGGQQVDADVHLRDRAELQTTT